MKKLQSRPVEKRLVLDRETVRVQVVEPSRAALGLVRGGAGDLIIVLEPQTSTTTTQQ